MSRGVGQGRVAGVRGVWTVRSNASGSCVMVTLAPLWTEWLTDGPTWLKALTSRNFINKFSIALGDRKVQSQKKGPMKDTPGIFTYLHLQSLCSDLLQELSNSFKIHSDNTKAHCIHAIYVFIILLEKSPFFYLLKFKVTFVAMILTNCLW